MSETVQPLPEQLHLGSGTDYREGWHNVDVSPAVGPDDVVDLDELPWPFPSDHFARVDAHHLVEHLADPIQALHEVARVLRPGGTFVLTYPIGHTRFEDPTHRQFWNWHTADVLAGDREHPHEVSVPLELVDRDVSWSIGYAEPLVWLYTRYRCWLSGAGPWLEQVPGVYGEVTATYEVSR